MAHFETWETLWVQISSHQTIELKKKKKKNLRQKEKVLQEKANQSIWNSEFLNTVLALLISQ